MRANSQDPCLHRKGYTATGVQQKRLRENLFTRISSEIAHLAFSFKRSWLHEATILFLGQGNICTAKFPPDDLCFFSSLKEKGVFCRSDHLIHHLCCWVFSGFLSRRYRDDSLFPLSLSQSLSAKEKKRATILLSSGQQISPFSCQIERPRCKQHRAWRIRNWFLTFQPVQNAWNFLASQTEFFLEVKSIVALPSLSPHFGSSFLAAQCTFPFSGLP